MYQCKEDSRDWILCEVQSVEGDEGYQGYRDEELETGDSRGVSRVWNQGVQDREGVGGTYLNWPRQFTTPIDVFVGLMGWLAAFVRDTTMTLVEDGALLRPRLFP